MTEKLYNSPSVCVRELLQNSLDALRYRRALKKLDESDWANGKVILYHTLDEYGHEVLSCTDNGVGMDEEIIKKFLTKVGRSYYRSPEFEQERIRFAKKGVDFDPCSRFGIGFMSCFMLGDQIVIKTRRDYGPNRGYSDPLIVEINGLGGILTIRKGSMDKLPGTTVKITGRKIPKFLDEFANEVNLIGVIDSYALACEFPIEANCDIPQIKNYIYIPPGIEKSKTAMEKFGINKCLTLKQDFSDISPNLRGCIRASFLLDKDNKLTLSNSEAYWDPGKIMRTLRQSNGKEITNYQFGDRICLDGILVCGQPGDRNEKYVRTFPIWSNNQIPTGEDYFTLDVRGELKPLLTPAREPPDTARSGYREISWDKLCNLALKAHGRLWERVACLIGKNLDHETFWKLALIHRAPIPWMRANIIWSHLAVPIVSGDKLIEWRNVSSIESLNLHKKLLDSNKSQDISYRILTKDLMEIGVPEEFIKWQSHGWPNGSLIQQLSELIVSISTLELQDGVPCITVRKPIFENISRADYKLHSILLLPYTEKLSHALSVQLLFHNNANCYHPLVLLAFNSKYLENPSDIEVFARTLVYTLGESSILESINSPIINEDFWINRRLRHLGALYLSIDWDRYSDNLSPPYDIWLKEKGMKQIKHEDFEQWASLNPAKRKD